MRCFGERRDVSTASEYEYEVLCFRSGLAPAEQATGSYTPSRTYCLFRPRFAFGESRPEKGGGFRGLAW